MKASAAYGHHGMARSCRFATTDGQAQRIAMITAMIGNQIRFAPSAMQKNGPNDLRIESSEPLKAVEIPMTLTDAGKTH
jgi:hypothetical protein